jgi:hypothetical protein
MVRGGRRRLRSLVSRLIDDAGTPPILLSSLPIMRSGIGSDGQGGSERGDIPVVSSMVMTSISRSANPLRGLPLRSAWRPHG